MCQVTTDDGHDSLLCEYSVGMEAERAIALRLADSLAEAEFYPSWFAGGRSSFLSSFGLFSALQIPE